MLFKLSLADSIGQCYETILLHNFGKAGRTTCTVHIILSQRDLKVPSVASPLLLQCTNGQRDQVKIGSKKKSTTECPI